MITAGLILEGGATRGVFTSGVLDYLMEKDIYLSHVIGVSAGSCNAVDYVSKQIGRTRDCMITQGEEYNYYYGLKDFVRNRSVLDMDTIFDKFPNELIPFDYDTYFASEITCEIVATNCLTGKAEYLTENHDRERLMRICRASSSMPLVCPIVNLDKTPYLDGGLADSIPVRRALKLGLEKNVVVLTRPRGYRKKPVSKPLARMYRRLYGKYPELVRICIQRNRIYNRTMELIEKLEAQGKIYVIRPEVKPVSRLEKDQHKLMAFYHHGYELMEKQLPDMMKYLGVEEENKTANEVRNA
ncbi:patatin family protein [Roseburia hominis]